jgi:hypothetical protein
LPQSSFFNNDDLEGLFFLFDPKRAGTLTAEAAASALARIGLDVTKIAVPESGLSQAAFVKLAQTALTAQRSL